MINPADRPDIVCLTIIMFKNIPTYVSLYEWRNREDFSKRFSVILHDLVTKSTLQSGEVETEEEADSWAASFGSVVTVKNFKPERERK